MAGNVEIALTLWHRRIPGRVQFCEKVPMERVAEDEVTSGISNAQVTAVHILL